MALKIHNAPNTKQIQEEKFKRPGYTEKQAKTTSITMKQKNCRVRGAEAESLLGLWYHKDASGGRGFSTSGTRIKMANPQ